MLLPPYIWYVHTRAFKGYGLDAIADRVWAIIMAHLQLARYCDTHETYSASAVLKEKLGLISR